MANLTGALKHDIRYGLRQLRVHPGFTATAVLSLALGIAANASIFTLVDQILLRMLPVENPRELVQFRLEGGRFGSQNGDGLHTFSHPLFLALRQRADVFSGITGQTPDRLSLYAGDRSEMVESGWVAGNFFQVLGVKPHLGRLLEDADDPLGAGKAVAVLQYDFWRTRYAGRNDVLGTTVRLNGSPFTIVGVAAPGFVGTNPGILTQLWVPVNSRPLVAPRFQEDLRNERSAWFYLFARLKPGMAIERAEAAVKVFYEQRKREEVNGAFFQQFPDTRPRFLRQTMTLTPAGGGMSALRRVFEKPLIVLQCLVGVVLLIACTNVANLLLARSAARQQEVAIRGALGARRWQLVRQLMIESLLLAAAGGAVALLLSAWLTRALVRFLPYDPSILSLSTTPDARVLLFTAAVTLATVLLFGLAPAFSGSRTAAASVIKETGGAVTQSQGHVRLRKSFVALQVALSTMLLIGAGLFVRTLDNLRHVNLGFDTEQLAMFGVRPATEYDAARKRQVFRSMLERLAATPGVAAVGANRARLLTGGRWDGDITIPGMTVRDGDSTDSFFNAVTPGYFTAMGIPVQIGRDFTWRDWETANKLCLVNAPLAERYFNGVSPIGRRVGQGRASTPDTEIIGVFAPSRYHDVRGEVPRQTFLNMSERLEDISSVTVYARLQGDPRRLLPLLREQVKQADANLVVYDMRTMDDQLNMRLANERMLSFLSAGFALLAALLAVVGLHGVLAFVVARRTREIGIRLALGAGQGDVVGLVMREMLVVILAGLAAGITAAFYLGRFVESQLFGVQPMDLPVFLLGVASLLMASLVAAFTPAWRASRISPVRALRYE